MEPINLLLRYTQKLHSFAVFSVSAGYPFRLSLSSSVQPSVVPAPPAKHPSLLVLFYCLCSFSSALGGRGGHCLRFLFFLGPLPAARPGRNLCVFWCVRPVLGSPAGRAFYCVCVSLFFLISLE